MQKIGYTKTSRDKGGPIFYFSDEDSTYRLRLAGNPILLLEAYYNKFGGDEFMKTYKAIAEGKQDEVSQDNIKILAKANKATKEFIDCIVELQKIEKSLLVIYKE